MERMFRSATSYNGDLSKLDVSSVTNMNSMFSGAISYNDDLSNWNVSSVTNMNGMFSGATSFSNDLSKWNVSGVNDMEYIFYDATSFNSDLSTWDVSSVPDMVYMFYRAVSFNQDLCAWADKFPYNSAFSIFSNSGCTFQDTPQLDRQGPFCASDCKGLLAVSFFYDFSSDQIMIMLIPVLFVPLDIFYYLSSQIQPKHQV
ncbi:hypothetical protein ACHAXR_000248 [Thalassiosira sp. AJA248-18]